MPQDGFLGLLDMLDGGGAGRAGPTFEGGPLSEFLNKLGIRPAGYRDRLAEARPMARPAGPGAAPPSAPPPRPANMIGNLTAEDILAAISRGAVQPPSVYGPSAITTSVLPPAAPQRMPTLQEIMEAYRFRRERDAATSFERSGIFRGI